MIDSLLRHLPSATLDRIRDRRARDGRALRGADAAPAVERRHARRRSGAFSTRWARLRKSMPVVFPVHPRTRQRLKEFGLDVSPGRLLYRSARLHRFPEPDLARADHPDRFRRAAGGIDRARHPVPDAAREHRAADHRHRRNQPGRRHRHRRHSRGVQAGARGRGDAPQAGSLGRGDGWTDHTRPVASFPWRADVVRGRPMRRSRCRIFCVGFVAGRRGGSRLSRRRRAAVLLPVGIRARGDAGVRARASRSRYADRAGARRIPVGSGRMPSIARELPPAAGTVALTPFQRTSRYLELTVALTWKITGRLVVAAGRSCPASCSERWRR